MDQPSFTADVFAIRASYPHAAELKVALGACKESTHFDIQDKRYTFKERHSDGDMTPEKGEGKGKKEHGHALPKGEVEKDEENEEDENEEEKEVWRELTTKY